MNKEQREEWLERLAAKLDDLQSPMIECDMREVHRLLDAFDAMEGERDKARAEVESLRTSRLDDDEERQRAHTRHWQQQCGEAMEERDEARTEVERLRELALPDPPPNRQFVKQLIEQRDEARAERDEARARAEKAEAENRWLLTGPTFLPGSDNGAIDDADEP